MRRFLAAAARAMRSPAENRMVEETLAIRASIDQMAAERQEHIDRLRAKGLLA